MTHSSHYAEAKAEAVQSARDACGAIVRQHHPAVYRRIEHVIARCDDPIRLTGWILKAPQMSDDEFLELIDSWEGRWQGSPDD